LSDRVGYSDHVRFRGYFPVHCIPAYNLPVYASQWPLPDTTQDLVRGCSLGFTAAAISGGRVQRAFKAQRAPNRAFARIVRHFASPKFWAAYEALPAAVRKLADANYELLKRDPRHPSLQFKKIGRYWSVRVGLRDLRVGRRG
jgi:hypothetical protein